MLNMLRFLARIKKKCIRFLKSGLLEQRARKGYYAVDIDTDVMGLGARIVNMIEILSYCDIKKYIPVFKFSYREKVNEDYFGELFSYKNLPVSILMTLQFTKIRDTSDLKWKNYDKKLSLTIAKDLFDKYFSFNQAILDEMDSFVRKWFLGKHVLGIHYRGSDKITEAPCVPLESLHKHVIEILEKEPSINLIFISSDETAVIHSLMSLQLPVSVVCRQDAIRSENGKQIHLQRQNSKTVINRDAIVNCLLLSKCNYLLKTASLLSDCSVIFNPTLKVLVLNAPYEHVTWWPTSEINKMENWHNVTIS